MEQIDGVNARSNLFDRLGRRPRKVCGCGCVCMRVRELVGQGLSEEEPGDGNSMEEYKPCLKLTGNLESRSGFTSVAGFRATCYKVGAKLYCCCCL